MSLILRQNNAPNTGPDFIKNSPLTYDQLDGNFAAISASFALRPVFQAGPGIIISGDYISASVLSVNGIFPDPGGNISLNITRVLTGPLSFRPASEDDGTVYIVSGDPTTSLNGDSYIYSTTAGQWFQIAPLDQAAADARYLLLNGSNSPLQGNINFGGYNATNAGTWQGTANTASFVTASNVAGPFGSNSVISASLATTASFITGSNVYGPYGTNSVVSASYSATASYAINAIAAATSRIISGSTIVQANQTGIVTISGSSEIDTKLTLTGSLIVGYNSTSGLHGVAFGTSSVAVGAYSFAHGDNVIASQSYSHAEGQGTVAAAAWSHTEGLNTRASQTYAHAEGSFTTASAQYSHTEGFRAITTAFYSHAEGYGTRAEGEASHAEGLYTSASGNYSHAEGSGSIAFGLFSHAEGSGSIAYGTGSHAEGLGTIASGSFQTVVGRYNQRTNTDSYFVIGNGTSDSSRSDYLRAGANGASITGSLIVSGAFTSSTDIQVGSQTVGRGGTSGAETFSTVFGQLALRSNTTGQQNIAIGYGSLAESTTGEFSLAIGVFAQSGSRGTRNQSVGYQTLQVVASGSEYNHAFGYRASRFLQSGSFNTTVGGLAAIIMTSGSNNVAVGYTSMAALPSGSNNVAVGYGAMYGTTTSPNQTNNVAIGHEANYTGSTGGVYLGYQAGYFETASNMLYIANSDTTTPLIKGNFSSSQLYISASVQITGSFLQGLTVSATGQYAHAQGLSTTASADYSHAEGSGSSAAGVASHAEGLQTVITAGGGYGHAEGWNTRVTALYAHAEGFLTTASGEYSHAEGRQNITTGVGSHAEGNGTTAANTYAHTEGQGTYASGVGSHAEGSFTSASGDNSHAEGSLTRAIGLASHAEGRETQASASYSHTSGYGTVASGSYQTVVGTFNIHGDTTEGAFIIGNGTSVGVRSTLLRTSGSQVEITGSVAITDVLVLPFQSPLPASKPTASIALSGSGGTFEGMYVYNGTTWTKVGP